MSRQKGNLGEDIAISFLVKKNFKIITKNYYTKHGEIDIIVTDKEYIVFVEVKYRTNKNFGSPAEAVTNNKIKKITKSAIYYISQNNIQNKDIRFDIIEITKIKNEYVINHIVDSFYPVY
ncbi:MAG: YraN family protein [Defluviitaleaceae bacterium]|nr:YraN family protein [Defluviitaleaceae bacterium]